MADTLKAKALCYVVTYNAAPYIKDVLDRLPAKCWDNDDYDFHVLISDDCSHDDTVDVCESYIANSPHGKRITVQRTPHNLGYGGNQKLGYDYAHAHGFDAVVLLHGDGQYDPGQVPNLIAPIIAGECGAVLGSRMLEKQNALKGGMPMYKFIGNMLLTNFQNRMLGTSLSEFHTGLRAYAVKSLEQIPYRYNSDGYVFDTEILIQLISGGHRILDIPIPTYYGDETCHVNGPKYAWRVVKATLGYRMHKLGFAYLPQYSHTLGRYAAKTDFASTHRFALEQAENAHVVLDLGGGDGYVAAQIKHAGKRVYGIDSCAHVPEMLSAYDEYRQMDLDDLTDVRVFPQRPDTVLLLDVLEHLKYPEKLLTRLRDVLDEHSRVIITVPNVAFLSIRIKLLLGSFSYTSRGIMDYTHLRFFTFSSIKALLDQQGYYVREVKGIPAPFPLVIKSRWLSNALLRLNIFLIMLYKGLFAFQIALVAQPKQISHDS